ncbi:MAG: DEAD/DEAH box helicase [Formosimonas sp.]
MSHDLFEQCQTINTYLNQGQDAQAREHLIKLLANGREHGEHTPLVNHLIRQTGLFPYLQGECIWQDQLVKELFTVDVGEEQPMPLHREQSAVLKELLNGENLLLSAPTSFGKSFIIDALIAIKKPTNVLIIVPTIALLDECRRRIFKKFSSSYKIISTAGCALGERNILVLTAERALHYVNALQAKGLEVLIVDEFYKIDSTQDERANSLQLLVNRIGGFAQQRYFLAPNIKERSSNDFFTTDMKFIEKLDFSTVFLNKTDVFKLLPKGKTKAGNKSKNVDLEAKSNYLINDILNKSTKKTLIYAGSYAQINVLSKLINERMPTDSSEKLNAFFTWVSQNYHADWGLAQLAQKGFGWHNGHLHRSLAQIQIKLFEEQDGLRAILCTSSVIEGVNTQAEQVVIWSNKNGRNTITTFEYKNIMGRAGRMFKYFVGDIYVMEQFKESVEKQLDLSLDENSTLSLTVDDEQTTRTKEQISEIIRYKEEMSQLFGGKLIEQLIRDGVFQTADKEFIRKIACDMRDDVTSWNGLSNLNNENPTEWERFIKKMIYLAHGKIVQYGESQKFCNFTCALFNHQDKEIRELIAFWSQEQNLSIDEAINEIFDWERKVSFNLATLAQDIETIYNLMHPKKTVNISHFYTRASFAFLHPIIYQLEEYGLPRMIANKIHASKIIDLKPNSTTENPIEIGNIIEKFQKIGVERICSIQTIDSFDQYIVEHFFDGIGKK